jgi:cholesterol transport system auxiliary component
MTRLSTLLAIASMLALVGCVTVSSGGDRRAVQTFVFASPTPSSATLGPGTGPVLLVSRPTAGADYGSRRMVYTQREFQLSHYAFSQWSDTPQNMLEPLLIHAMEAAQSFEAVVNVSHGVLANLRLDTEIEMIRHEFFSSPSEVRIIIRVQLVDIDERILLATETFEVLERAPTDDAYGGVTAVNTGLARVLGQIVVFATTYAQ